MGHRGSMGAVTENTAAAIGHALHRNADGFECDVRCSRDGRVFLLHDSTLARTASWTPRKGTSLHEHLQIISSPVEDLDWQILRQVPLEGGQKLIELKTAVSMLPQRAQCLVEVKGSDPSIVPILEKEALINNMEPSKVAFIGFDLPVMTAMKRALPDFMCLLVMPYQPRWAGGLAFGASISMSSDLKQRVRQAAASGLDGIDVPSDGSLEVEELVALAKTYGMLVASWPFFTRHTKSDSLQRMEWCRKMGVDIFVSDFRRKPVVQDSNFQTLLSVH